MKKSTAIKKVTPLKIINYYAAACYHIYDYLTVLNDCQVQQLMTWENSRIIHQTRLLKVASD